MTSNEFESKLGVKIIQKRENKYNVEENVIRSANWLKTCNGLNCFLVNFIVTINDEIVKPIRVISTKISIVIGYNDSIMLNIYVFVFV